MGEVFQHQQKPKRECYLCNDTGIQGGSGPYGASFCVCKAGDAQRALLQWGYRLLEMGYGNTDNPSVELTPS